MQPIVYRRRPFLTTLATGALAGVHALAAERPAVTQPRATSGDDASEPNWDERLTITVGPNKDAQIVGRDDKAIQAAVDYVTRLGGGTVRLLPGAYELANAVYLKSNLRLLGSGTDTVLTKRPSVTTKLSADSDWFDQEITLADARGFRVGDGVCLQTRDPDNGGLDVLKRTLVARSGNRFKLDRPLRENFWLGQNSTCSTLFPILTGEEIRDVVIENLVLDGNRTQNENLNGNYAGCIFLQDCSKIQIRGVTARNYNGDGISWQICHDVTVDNCHSFGHAGLGLHPGSGSQRPIIRSNRLENNSIGLFFCWGVRYGLAEKNHLQGNRVGISIGHRDTDNLIVENHVRDSTEVGIVFRPERGERFAPHRNRFERNHLENNGPLTGSAIDIQGAVTQVTLKENHVRDSRAAQANSGVKIGKDVGVVHLLNNKIEGFAAAVTDLRKPVASAKTG